MTPPVSSSETVRPEQAQARVDQLRERVNAALSELELREQPALLYEPVRYVLRGGGKRLRPVLLLLTAEAFGTDPHDALPAALAVE
ncbi:MAG: polyprenyl synthetase family protein, partial [Bacteroidetes bacterium QS_1_65_9]